MTCKALNHRRKLVPSLVRRSVITGTMIKSVGGENGADVSGGLGEIPYYHDVISASGITDFTK